MSMLDTSNAHASFELEDSRFLDPLHYFQILKKRKFYAIIPFLCVFAIGTAIVMLWPPTYQSEGKILVESQQIPVDLVRPTVTATGSERIATIQQRVMTRDNLLKIADKYQMYADQRERLSRTEILDLMRANTILKPIQLDPQATQNPTVAITVGFTDRRADTATKVANELITLFLNEDARNRTSRATETTKFLAQEVDKLQSELAAVDEKILASRRQLPMLEGTPQLTALKAEFAVKSGVYSESHPEMRRLKAMIESLEKTPGTVSQAQASGMAIPSNQLLDPLLLHRMSIQTNLENTSQKLAAARRGESLERDQFSERLEVLEQAVLPQKPAKPNRPRLIALALCAAIAAGFAGVWTIESIDKTIRNNRDLAAAVNGQLIVSIPYIVTKAELFKKKHRLILALGIIVATLLVTLIGIHFVWRPLDELWPIVMARLGF
jgi:uncharacterized protein involved in exopolysaccharide biosynthesis